MAAVINMLLVLLTVGVATVLSQSDVQTRVSKLEQCVGECRAANCLIDVKAYSGAKRCQPMSGHVKLNGNFVWRGSWCDNSFPNHRGLNTFLIDPFNCSVDEWRRWDTHDIEVDAAAYLNEYLMLLNHGSVVVGVSADEARNNLQGALTQLRHLGADVADVKHRGSFAFIAQKGYPRKTVLRKVLTEERSNINPAHFIASVNGMVDDLPITVS